VIAAQAEPQRRIEQGILFQQICSYQVMTHCELQYETLDISRQETKALTSYSPLKGCIFSILSLFNRCIFTYNFTETF
jgi:hypothetical protein